MTLTPLNCLRNNKLIESRRFVGSDCHVALGLLAMTLNVYLYLYVGGSGGFFKAAEEWFLQPKELIFFSAIKANKYLVASVRPKRVFTILTDSIEPGTPERVAIFLDYLQPI